MISKNYYAMVLGLLLVLSLATCSSDETVTTTTSEGTSANPIPLTLADLPRDSTVGDGGSSYYRVTGLNSLQSYFITASNLRTDGDLFVDTTGFNTGVEGCFSVSGVTAESCSAGAGGAGELYIQVLLFSNGVGSGFILNVQ